jgi:hypothetical protein
MATNETTIENLEELLKAIQTIKKCEKNLKLHIAQQKRQMNKGW